MKKTCTMWGNILYFLLIKNLVVRLHFVWFLTNTKGKTKLYRLQYVAKINKFIGCSKK